MPIRECGEPLVPIPAGQFAFYDPHPYVALGAVYGNISPWQLRKNVLQALEYAQENLQRQRPGWRFKLFDAYRPNSVQAYMVEREFGIQARAAGLDPAALSPDQREMLGEKVYRIFGAPSSDPLTPPLHSTGGAIDCTFADEKGCEVDMGAPIDECSDRSNPDYFAAAADAAGRKAHENRVLLNALLRAEGFHQMSDEWWHFSLRDQWWAWCQRKMGIDPAAIAAYGRTDLL